MITVKIKPRQDDLYDMYVGDEGDHFVNSDQGYANSEDCIAIARRLWPPIELPDAGIAYAAVLGPEHIQAVVKVLRTLTEPVVMQVTFRDGKTHTEQLR